MVGRADDLRSKRQVNAVSAAIGEREHAKDFELTPRRLRIVGAPACVHLDRDVTVRCQTEHSSARTGRHTDQDGQSEIEAGHMQEDGTHGRLRLDGVWQGCQSSAPRVKPAEIASESGVPMLDTLRDSARVRTRPILMTAFGSAVGMLPIAMERAIGLERLGPLEVVAIGD